MNNYNPKTKNTAKTVSVITATALLVSAVAVGALSFVTKYNALFLLALAVFMPTLSNLWLLLPFGKQTLDPQPEVPEAKKGFFAKLGRAFLLFFRAIARFCRKLAAFCAGKRSAIIVALCIMTLVGSNILFWSRLLKTNEHTLNFIVPVVLVVIFVIFIVLDKLCRYVLSNSKPGYYTSILRNLDGAIVFLEIAIALTAVASAVCALGLIDLGFWLGILLAVLFVYETAFLAVSVAVRMIRNEFATNPDFYIPLPGKRANNLGIISYLEQNTGITMRSLWSIRLIKQIIPFAALGSVLVLWLCSGIVFVESYQSGALYRLGKLREETLSPGLHFTLPWPIDKTEIYDTDTVNEITVGYLATEPTDNLWTETHGEGEYRLLLGGGNELVSINLRVEYRISDLKNYLQYSANPVSLLESAAYETVTACTINTDLDTLLAADRTQFSNSFSKDLSTRISKYNTGLEIVDVVVESIHPPIDVADIYQQIISAGIQAEQLILEAEGKAGVTVAEAKTESDKAINQATASNHKEIAAANSSVAEFLASVEADNNNSDGYRYYKYLEAVKAAYKDAKLIIVGQGIDSENIYFGNVNGAF